jgi:nitroreductase
MDVQQAIQTRRAVRLFSDQPVPQDVIEQILLAGGRAQSSKNSQPWQFVVVRERETLQALSKLGDYAGHLAGASFAVCLVGSTQSHWNSFDLGQAASHLQLAAWELGVGSCIAAIYDQDAGKALLGLPAESNFYCAISFGYPSPEHRPAQMGGRKGLDELVRWERW